MTQKITVRCFAPAGGGYAPISDLRAEKREELSRSIVREMGDAIQERVNRFPAEFERLGAAK